MSLAKRFILIIFSILSFQFSGLTQQLKIDSLRAQLINESNDTLIMNLQYELGKSYSRVNLDSSLWAFNRALLRSQELELIGSEIQILDWLGYVHVANKEYPKALRALLKGIELAKNPELKKYDYQGEELSEKMVRHRLLTMYSRMGELYTEIGNTDENMAYFKKARGMAIATNDSSSIYFSDILIAYSYLVEGKIDSAYLYADHAELMLRNVSKPPTTSICILKGSVFLKKGEFDRSEEYLRRGLEIGVKGQEQLDLIYSELSELYFVQNKLDSALVYASLAKDFSKRRNSDYELKDVYKLLADIYEEKGMVDSALIYLRESILLGDSLNRAEKQNLMSFQDMGFDQQYRIQELEKEKIRSQSQFRTYALLVGVAVFLMLAILLYRNNRIRTKANRVLRNQKENLEATLEKLKSTQAQLIQSEKMASLGELTAGIAHEIQNPLNFVNNFSEVSDELMDEMEEELGKGAIEEAKALSADIRGNLAKITHHGKRADAIVKGMLAHSRSGKGEKAPTDLNALAEEYLKLSYHGLRAKDKSFNADFKTDFDPKLPKINVVPQDIGRVLLNLINNAFQAVSAAALAKEDKDYKPAVTVKTQLTTNDQILITIKDNGPGIPSDIKDKIFQPFFTTKPTGQGTGLGLSLSYDIVKAHGGEITCKSEEGKALPADHAGTEFIIKLPQN